MIVLHQQHLQNTSTELVEIVPFRGLESKGIAKELCIIPASAHPSLPPTQVPGAEREAEWTIAAVKEALGKSSSLMKSNVAVLTASLWQVSASGHADHDRR